MLIMTLIAGVFSSCGTTAPEKEETTTKSYAEDESVASVAESISATETTTETTTADAAENKVDEDGIRSDFKESMDGYEAFMDEYVAFMQKYNENPGDVGLLADYAKFMSQYADMLETFEKWENEDLNTAELAYYLEVQSRVNEKLLEVTQ